jgi:hypothetical protein
MSRAAASWDMSMSNKNNMGGGNVFISVVLFHPL